MKSYQKEFIMFLIKRNALKFGEFKLKSGRISPYFLNLGMLHDGEAFQKIGMFYAETIHANFKNDFDLLFGPAYKGIALSTAAAIGLNLQYNQNVLVSFNRKETKDHGEGGQIIGASLDNKRIILVDDVITAGTTIREAMKFIEEANAKLIGIVISLDRQEIGLQSSLSAIQEIRKKYTVEVTSIITLDDLINFLREEKSSISDGELYLSKILEYKAKYGINSEVLIDTDNKIKC